MSEVNLWLLYGLPFLAVVGIYIGRRRSHLRRQTEKVVVRARTRRAENNIGL